MQHSLPALSGLASPPQKLTLPPPTTTMQTPESHFRRSLLEKPGHPLEFSNRYSVSEEQLAATVTVRHPLGRVKRSRG